MLHGHFALDAEPGIAIFVISFSYRHGLPRDADLVFDVRFLRNPHYVDALRPKTGRDADVGAYIEADPDFARFFGELCALGRGGCCRATSARARAISPSPSAAPAAAIAPSICAERLAAWLRSGGRRVELAHRDIDRSSGTRAAGVSAQPVKDIA